MAEPLKNHFGVEIPRRIAGMIHRVYPAFGADAFVADALNGYEPLELLPRGWHIARALHRHLPPSYPAAVEILVASFGPVLGQTEQNGMAPFLYLPHACFIAEHGLDHFEHSMQAQYELTQRFTAEFSIRPYLERHQEQTLKRLHHWASDPSVHVRRLVSEGTRPRLPWASRLRAFQADPRPVLALLDLLKDDSELYVRRSVANNLNDIGKDNPDVLIRTAQQWMRRASTEREWLVRHALRSMVKAGDARALAILGFGGDADVAVRGERITPGRPRMGGSVEVSFEVENVAGRAQSVLVDFRVHFVKANGQTSAKVFKMKAIELAPGQRAALRKTVSLADLTTRRHYPGRHVVEVILNGRVAPLGAFELLPTA